MKTLVILLSLFASPGAEFVPPVPLHVAVGQNSRSALQNFANSFLSARTMFGLRTPVSASRYKPNSSFQARILLTDMIRSPRRHWNWSYQHYGNIMQVLVMSLGVRRKPSSWTSAKHHTGSSNMKEVPVATIRFSNRLHSTSPIWSNSRQSARKSTSHGDTMEAQREPYNTITCAYTTSRQTPISSSPSSPSAAPPPVLLTSPEPHCTSYKTGTHRISPSLMVTKMVRVSGASNCSRPLLLTKSFTTANLQSSSAQPKYYSTLAGLSEPDDLLHKTIRELSTKSTRALTRLFEDAYETQPPSGNKYIPSSMAHTAKPNTHMYSGYNSTLPLVDKQTAVQTQNTCVCSKVLPHTHSFLQMRSDIDIGNVTIQNPKTYADSEILCVCIPAEVHPDLTTRLEQLKSQFNSSSILPSPMLTSSFEMLPVETPLLATVRANLNHTSTTSTLPLTNLYFDSKQTTFRPGSTMKNTITDFSTPASHLSITSKSKPLGLLGQLPISVLGFRREYALDNMNNRNIETLLPAPTRFLAANSTTTAWVKPVYQHQPTPGLTSSRSKPLSSALHQIFQPRSAKSLKPTQLNPLLNTNKTFGNLLANLQLPMMAKTQLPKLPAVPLVLPLRQTRRPLTLTSIKRRLPSKNKVDLILSMLSTLRPANLLTRRPPTLTLTQRRLPSKNKVDLILSMLSTLRPANLLTRRPPTLTLTQRSLPSKNKVDLILSMLSTMRPANLLTRRPPTLTSTQRSLPSKNKVDLILSMLSTMRPANLLTKRPPILIPTKRRLPPKNKVDSILSMLSTMPPSKLRAQKATSTKHFVDMTRQPSVASTSRTILGRPDPPRNSAANLPAPQPLSVRKTSPAISSMKIIKKVVTITTPPQSFVKKNVKNSVQRSVLPSKSKLALMFDAVPILLQPFKGIDLKKYIVNDSESTGSKESNSKQSESSEKDSAGGGSDLTNSREQSDSDVDSSELKFL